MDRRDQAMAVVGYESRSASLGDVPKHGIRLHRAGPQCRSGTVASRLRADAVPIEIFLTREVSYRSRWSLVGTRIAIARQILPYFEDR